MGEYSIRDLEQLTGIKAHTIRVWEKRYGVVSPSRTPTNIRYYCDTDLRKLLNLAILNENGYRISYLSGLPEDELCQKARGCVECSENQHSVIDMLVLAAMELDETEFTQRFQEVLDHFGFEETFRNIVLPFLEKLGTLWQVGTINTAQEHFISNILRNKFLLAIEELPAPPRENPSLLMYLPEGEHHEFSLLFAYYTAKKNGIRVYYFGQTLPQNDLLEIVEQQKPDGLMAAFITSLHSTCILEHLRKLRKSTNAPVYIFGAQTQNLSLNTLPSGVIRLNSPNMLKTALESLPELS